MKVSSIYLTLFLAIIMLLSSCSNTETEDKYFYLKGTVKDASGNPVENAIIQLGYDMDTLKSRPGTTISFALPNNQHVKLWITRKSDNELVKTLLDTNLTSGVHSINWDFKNKYGKFIRNDIYLYNLKLDTIEISKRFYFNNIITNQAYTELDYYAKSNQKGQFQIDLSQLAIGELFDNVNEAGDTLNQLTISPNVKIWAILPDNSRSIIKRIKVQPNTDTSTDVNFTK